ncbi:XrtA/PEP-CTERM system exopolysaccharide export protein [Kordiimonas sp. SCSIO 12610]|uniref:XrtA/PEP-CTERM system exopolysaccharide export protein n=1 Tax=Kordiimonas sp. SCSIO 12610 TaxID=2829597 RepID=UPI00210BC1D4|nr:XrtA/PEP-CTERM system exopolysaccharide export protein [Kordiimonas sp. SCSIO 12610]UTW54157.1 polysaccharide export protein [Kordiimonas sp. SCSIO 12610]
MKFSIMYLVRKSKRYFKTVTALMISSFIVAACGSGYPELPPAPFVPPEEGPGENYLIGPRDDLEIFVWRNPELSLGITVRPDGRFSMPLVEDLPATGKTPSQLARDIEAKLADYLQQPIVTVIVRGFVGPFSQQVRVVGEATNPQSIAYRANMTLLDVMIDVGGLTEFAAGDRATLVRFENGQQKEYSVRIESLIKDGDIRSNVKILPGDVLIIPESIF